MCSPKLLFSRAASRPWLSAAALALLALPSVGADLILHNARVITVDSAFSVSEAIAIKGNLVLQTGSNGEILKLRDDRSQVIDLGGGVVIPGLIDSHTHAANACLTEFDHEIPEMNSIADVLAFIKRRTTVVPPGDWIVLQQIFITRLREQRYPTRAELDEVAPMHPVLFRTGPDASVNSLALQLSGIDRTFEVADGGSGFAEKDAATGELTGILRNCTRYVKWKPSTRTATPEQHEARLRELFADYNSVGITGICDRDTSLESMDRYRGLHERGELTVRVALSHSIATLGDIAKIQERIRSVARHSLFTEQNDWLRIIGIKTYLDGGMLTGSAYMRQPWGTSAIYGITDPAYRGVLFVNRERLLALARTAVGSGLQFTAHSQGDGAVHELLDVYEQLAKEGLPVAQTRCAITHSSFMSKEAIEQAARLGIVIDLQPAWLYLDTRTLVGHFGWDRLRWFIPLRSLFAAGAIVGGGSDHMLKIGSLRSNNPYNPFLGIATAVTRRARWYDGALHPEESLTREQALRFYTINNARLLCREDRSGSLEPGKLADLAVVDTDLLTCPEEKIADTKVLRTYVDGKLVYQRPPD
jgi:predicted amidohydrolase YtcJ